MKKLAIMSDLHMNLIKLKAEVECDYIIIAGDLMSSGSRAEFTKIKITFENMLSINPKLQIFWLLGNHDVYPSENFDKIHTKLPSNVKIMKQGIIQIENKTIYLNGHSLFISFHWVMQYHSGNEKNQFDDCIGNIDWFISHAPPAFKQVDEIKNGKRIGSKVLTNLAIDNDIKKWFFGHLHVEDMMNPCEFSIEADIELYNVSQNTQYLEL